MLVGSASSNTPWPRRAVCRRRFVVPSSAAVAPKTGRMTPSTSHTNECPFCTTVHHIPAW